MLPKTKPTKKNPLTKAQDKLLKHSLKKLLGNGLIDEQPIVRVNDSKVMILKNALNAIALDITE